MRDRINSSIVSFYVAIKRNELKSFKDLVIKSIIKTKAKQVTIAAERRIFGRLLVIAKEEGRETMILYLLHSKMTIIILNKQIVKSFLTSFFCHSCC